MWILHSLSLVRDYRIWCSDHGDSIVLAPKKCNDSVVSYTISTNKKNDNVNYLLRSVNKIVLRICLPHKIRGFLGENCIGDRKIRRMSSFSKWHMIDNFIFIFYNAVIPKLPHNKRETNLGARKNSNILAPHAAIFAKTLVTLLASRK